MESTTRIVRTDLWKRSELANGKGPNWPLVRSELTNEKGPNWPKKNIWCGPNLPLQKGPNWPVVGVRIDQGLRSELTRAE